MRTTGFYILTLLTGGQFALIWLFLMASQVNNGNNSINSKLKHYAVIFFTLYIIYLSLVFYGMYQFSQGHAGATILHNPIVFAVLLTIAVGLLWYAGVLLFRIARYIRSQTIELPGNAVLILLVFCYAAAFPLLQSRLNRAHLQSV